jgi:protein-disulfide isomerase-like protein with CxxC motif
VSWLLVAHLMLVCAYAGFQWTVRLVVYPQFALVPADPPAAFARYELAHQQRITRLVGPLFGGQVLTTAGVLAFRPDGASLVAALAAAALLAVVLGLTGLLAVPEHRRLSAGWDDAAFRRLLRVDAFRVTAATVNAAVAVVLLR